MATVAYIPGLLSVAPKTERRSARDPLPRNKASLTFGQGTHEE